VRTYITHPLAPLLLAQGISDIESGTCGYLKGDLMMKTHSASNSGREPKTKGAQHSPLRRIFTSGELFCDARLIIIEHAGEEYRLQITGKDKLILTK